MFEPQAALVRSAVAADGGVLASLAREHAIFEHSTAACTGEVLSSAIRRGALLAWIAELRAAPIGYATATVDFSTWRGAPFLYMDCLFVSSDHRGRGIGARLLEAVRQAASQKGIETLEWQTPAWNADAIRFYRRHGAIASEKIRFASGLPTIAANTGSMCPV